MFDVSHISIKFNLNKLVCPYSMVELHLILTLRSFETWKDTSYSLAWITLAEIWLREALETSKWPLPA